MCSDIMTLITFKECKKHKAQVVRTRQETNVYHDQTYPSGECVRDNK